MRTSKTEEARAKKREWERRRAKNMTEEQRQKRREAWKRSNAKPINKLHSRLRTRLAKFYRGRHIGGCKALTGLSREGLMLHLSSQLKRGMTLENYGSKWHIDHTIPCRAFDLTRHDEIKRCFHFSNLKPMWAFENMSKGGKIIKRQPELPFALHE